ncbi:ABC transporter substrate-binding protein [Sphaerochaeta sp.]|uniref:ABC transporter substrate-binding protein n=1 Tax=Sphaerochaeta sp. TaxID=1972642 RepID=UPI003D0A6AD9
MKKLYKVSFAVLCIVLLMTPVFAAGSKESSEPAVSAAASQTKEAPMLAEQVAAGTLPKLADRLPATEDIMVAETESIGAYGDAITFSFRGKDDQWTTGKITEEGLFRFTSEGLLEPNVAKGFSVNEDSTEFTVYLREGMKWSDGMPFTSEDVLFFYYHMLKPKTFGKSLWDCFYSTNPETKVRTEATMEKIDDYSFKVSFTDPSPSFLENLAINGKWCYAPKHYYVEILPEFIGQEAAEAKAKELGFKDVAAMGKETGYYFWNNVGRPTLRPWVASNSVDSDLHVWKRNPYFWKTDSEGKQLPYVDELRFVRISDPSQTTLKAMAGETDIAFGLDWGNIVALKQNEERSNYSLITWPTTKWAHTAAALQLNQTAEDPKVRALFQSKDFRQALSIAADREEMAELVADGFSTPAQSSPAKGAMGYDPEWTSKWTEYNPQKAKQLLEGLGLVMGSDGYYNFADGSDFILEILTHNDTSATARAAELLTEKYFKNIGIKATFGVRDRSLIDDMLISNKIEAIISPVSPAETFNISLRPDTLVPVRNYAAWYGTYGNWYESNGKEGLEPTGDMLKLIDLYREMLSATNKGEIDRIALEMLNLHKENIWEIGYLSDVPLLLSVNNDLANFSENEVYCDEFRGLGVAHIYECYFTSDL